MRGFLVGALVLVAMDVVLAAPLNRVTTGLSLPSKWLAEWMSPNVPLIPNKAGTTAATSASTSSQSTPTLL